MESFSEIFNSVRIDFSHTPSLAANAAATYLASVDDKESVICFFERQAIAPPASVHSY